MHLLSVGIWLLHIISYIRSFWVINRENQVQQKLYVQYQSASALGSAVSVCVCVCVCVCIYMYVYIYIQYVPLATEPGISLITVTPICVLLVLCVYMYIYTHILIALPNADAL